MEKLIYGENVKDGDIVNYADNYIARVSNMHSCDKYFNGKVFYANGGTIPQKSWTLATKWQAETLRLSIKENKYTEADEKLFSKTEFEYPSGYLIDKIEQPVDIDFLN